MMVYGGIALVVVLIVALIWYASSKKEGAGNHPKWAQGAQGAGNDFDTTLNDVREALPSDIKHQGNDERRAAGMPTMFGVPRDITGTVLDTLIRYPNLGSSCKIADYAAMEEQAAHAHLTGASH